MGDPTREYLRERLQENADGQTMTVYCLHCPAFSASGPASEARAASERHRLQKHPELAERKKIVRKRRPFSGAMTADREAEIEEERRQRMRALGIT